ADAPRAAAKAGGGVAGGGPGAALLPEAPAGGSVRAGEWDDNANYREFKRWLQSESRFYHPADVSTRRVLVVRDGHGHAVPACPGTSSDEAQHSVRLMPAPPGRAILFPRAEGLSGQNLTAVASCSNSSATAHVGLEDEDDVVDLRLSGERSLSAVRNVD